MKKDNWSKMTKAQKKIEVAKDVIKQLKVGAYQSTSGTYLEIINDTWEIQEEQANKCISKDFPCKVCALGSIFMSHVMLRNHLTIDELEMTDDIAMRKRLEGVFTNNQLHLIETAFERRIVNDDIEYICKEPRSFWNSVPTTIGQKAIDFGKKYSDSTVRLIMIMKNIIKNDGQFKP